MTVFVFCFSRPLCRGAVTRRISSQGHKQRCPGPSSHERSESKNLDSEAKKLEDQNSQTTEFRSEIRTLSVEPRDFQGRTHRIQDRDIIQIRNRIQIRDRIVRGFQRRASLNSTLRINSCGCPILEFRHELARFQTRDPQNPKFEKKQVRGRRP